MGIDWIRTARPREGHEAEYGRLRAIALAEIDSLEGFDSPNWYSHMHGLDGEELAAVLRSTRSRYILAKPGRRS
jgi:hypothetical protein